jgi:hypothetical protein
VKSRRVLSQALSRLSADYYENKIIGRIPYVWELLGNKWLPRMRDVVEGGPAVIFAGTPKRDVDTLSAYQAGVSLYERSFSIKERNNT